MIKSALVQPGDRFGKLVVQEVVPGSKKTRIKCECLCDCGNTHTVAKRYLIEGVSHHCGCKDLTGTNATHGMSGKPVYVAWTCMKDRCYRLESKDYNDYGGRGIKVCNRWLESFENFYEDMGDKPSKDHSLDRIDNDGDYCPENCRWATRSHQSRNRRGLRMIEHGGVTLCMSEWAERQGLKYGTVKTRLYRYGWTLEESLGFKERKR